MNNLDVVHFQQAQQSKESPIDLGTNIVQLDIAYVNIKAKKDGSNFYMKTYLRDAPIVYVTQGSWYEKNMT